VYPLDAEARQLGQALHQLRIEKNPDAALEALADYQRRFPGGQLSEEARLAELDANLALGRPDRALELLDSPPGAGPAPRQAELDLLRAGLLVDLGRCGEALPALTRHVDATAGSAHLAARALYLRALCAARDGDSIASRRDLEDYLRRFPDQAEHRAVEDALDRLSGP
jgi:tetratricopeptide (TPR) repeat protein